MIYFCVRKQEIIPRGKVFHYCLRRAKCSKVRFFANYGALKKYKYKRK